MQSSPISSKLKSLVFTLNANNLQDIFKCIIEESELKGAKYDLEIQLNLINIFTKKSTKSVIDFINSEIRMNHAVNSLIIKSYNADYILKMTKNRLPFLEIKTT